MSIFRARRESRRRMYRRFCNPLEPDTSPRNAKLWDAKLQDAKLQDAELQDARLRDVKLQDAKIQDAKLQDAKLQQAKPQDSLPSPQGADGEGQIDGTAVKNKSQTPVQALNQVSSSLSSSSTKCPSHEADPLPCNETVSSSTCPPELESTVYHIYHTGLRTYNYAIYKIADKDFVLPQVDDPEAPNYVDEPKLKASKFSTAHDGLRFLSSGSWKKPQDKNHDGIRRVKRWRCCDHPKLDPRIPTAPYFVHTPSLFFHVPPRTLRRGGSKTAPTICLFQASCFWKHYNIKFSDQFASESVIDGRGVVSDAVGAPRRREEVPKGYRVRSWRAPTETGKQFHKMANKKGTHKEEPTDAPPAPTKDEEPPSTRPSSLKEQVARPIHIDEKVRLSWVSPLFSPRKYHFKHGGIDFYWKGTATVKDKKWLGFLLAFAHLKLVAVVPATPANAAATNANEKNDSDNEKRSRTDRTPTEEVCLGKYTSLMAARKSGRLEVFDREMYTFAEKYMFPSRPSPSPSSDMESENVPVPNPTPDSPSPSPTSTEIEIEIKKRWQRLQDVIMATAMCMIISEEHKREATMAIFWELLESAGEGGGG
ncbi:MAG: hypothetical protein M1837_003885 [Sclerophora amabilis]|nr:MAG: hypothetical protein M1837_003885 [Sclerophora amabilis]